MRIPKRRRREGCSCSHDAPPKKQPKQQQDKSFGHPDEPAPYADQDAMQASLAHLTTTGDVADAQGDGDNGELLPFPEIDPSTVVPNFEAAFHYAAKEPDEVDLNKGLQSTHSQTGEEGSK